MSDRAYDAHGVVGNWLFAQAVEFAKKPLDMGEDLGDEKFLRGLLAERDSSPADVPPSEAFLRSAASRLYYEAYHKALTFADKKGLKVIGDARGSHDELIKRLHGHNPLLTVKMRSIKAIRTHADYDLQTFFEPSRVDEAKKRLVEIVGMLK